LSFVFSNSHDPRSFHRTSPRSIPSSVRSYLNLEWRRNGCIFSNTNRSRINWCVFRNTSCFAQLPPRIRSPPCLRGRLNFRSLSPAFSNSLLLHPNCQSSLPKYHFCTFGCRLAGGAVFFSSRRCSCSGMKLCAVFPPHGCL
jgi:hypothetical protein